jgi:hypothetical protein
LHKRRILDLQGTFGIGKSTFVDYLKDSAWWAQQELASPGVFVATGFFSMTDFLQAYKGERIVVFDFERGCKGSLSKKALDLINLLSDAGRTHKGPKYASVSKVVAAHVVVVGNEAPNPGYAHKEVWSLRVQSKDQAVVWHFPGEGPRHVASCGFLGEVANPWDRFKNPELARAVADWRARDLQNLTENPRLQLQWALPRLSDAVIVAIQQAVGAQTLLDAARPSIARRGGA